jgi:hypothetical protein
MMNRPDLRSWIFTLLVGGGVLGISLIVFVLSYFRLRAP